MKDEQTEALKRFNDEQAKIVAEYVQKSVIEELEKIKTEIIKYHQIDCNLNCDNCKYIGCIEAEDAVADIKIIDKHISEIKGD